VDLAVYELPQDMTWGLSHTLGGALWSIDTVLSTLLLW